jgi:threonine aldolase
MAHCERGDEYLVPSTAHCYKWEAGGAAVMGSIQPQPLPVHPLHGTVAISDILDAVKPDDAHYARTRLLVLENTTGGKVLPLEYLQAAVAAAKDKGLSTHLDGARLFNAAAAQATAIACAQKLPTPDASAIVAEAKKIAALFDSVSVCFSKGLGAPVGSCLLGNSKDFLYRAHRVRKMAGGGMRQAGILAAAAGYALSQNIARLVIDHDLAAHLASALSKFPHVEIDGPHTNMVRPINAHAGIRKIADFGLNFFTTGLCQDAGPLGGQGFKTYQTLADAQCFGNR